MSTVLPTDKVLVQRAATLHSAPADMSTVQDTDLLLINRAGVDYKCSVADWKASQASINKPRMLTPANGAGETVTPVSDVITTVAQGPFTANAVAQTVSNNVPANLSAMTQVFAFNVASLGVINWNTDFTATLGVTWTQLLFYWGNTSDLANWKTWTRQSSGAPGGTTNFSSFGNGKDLVIIVGNVSSAAVDGQVIGTITKAGVKGYALGVLTKLTFATDKSLASFSVGDSVTQSDSAASGVISAVDVSAKTMDFMGAGGTWGPANTGKTVIGAPKLSTDAAVGETPTFTSSAFSATGSLTHASSDWQVTLKTDTAFASPVVQSMADTAHLLSWDGGPLQPNTDYIVRVRHNGSGGVVSPWSDAVGFKTKAAFILTTAPGDAWASKDGAALTAITAPVKLINLATSNAHLYGVGVDGHVYVSAAGATMALVAYRHGDIAQVAPFYDASGKVNYTAVLTRDGAIYGYNATGVEVPGPPGIKFMAIMSGGGVSDSVAAVAEDGSVYVFATAAYAGVAANLTAWVHYPVVLPGGRVPKKVASLGGATDYQADGVAILATDGTLWQMGYSDAPGLPAKGTYSAPAQVSPGTLFKQINNVNGASGTRFAMAALSTTDKIWYAAKATQSNSGVDVPWGEKPWGTGFKDCVYGPYSAHGPIYGLKDDGYLYCSPANGNFTFVKVPGQTKPITSLGNIRSATQLASTSGYVIIP